MGPIAAIAQAIFTWGWAAAGGYAAGGLAVAAGYAAVAVAAGAFAYGVSLLIPDVPDFPSVAQEGQARKGMFRDSLAPKKLIYGEIMASGPVAFAETTTSFTDVSSFDSGYSGYGGTWGELSENPNKKNAVLHMIVILAPHEIESVKDIYFGDDRCDIDRYAGKFKINAHLGTTDQLADPELVANVSQWTSDHRLRGLAYLYCIFIKDEEVWNGVPQVRAIVEGKNDIYDPRDTNTKYTKNWALCCSDFIQHEIGFNAVYTDIHENALIAAANVSDELLNPIPITTISTSSQKSSTISAIHNRTEYYWVNNEWQDERTAKGIRIFIDDVSEYVVGETITVTGNSVSDFNDTFTISSINADGKYLYVKDVPIADPPIGSGGTVTANDVRITFTASHYLLDNDNVTITDHSVGGYNGTHTEKVRATSNTVISLFGVAYTSDGTGGASTTPQVRYELHGMVSSEHFPGDNLERMLDAGGGAAVLTQGKWVIHPGAYSAPVRELTADDLREDLTYRMYAPRNELFNTVKGTYISPKANWDGTEFGAITNSTYVTEDGDELVRDIQLYYVKNEYQAQRIAKMKLEKSRQAGSVVFPAKLTAIDLAVMECIELTIPQLGWNKKEFKIVDWGLNERGVDLVLREEASASYNWSTTDATLRDPAPNTNLPSPWALEAPTNLTGSTYALVIGSIPVYETRIEWTPPNYLVKGYYLEWKQDNYLSIEGITNANPAVVTITGHNFSNGTVIRILDVGGMIEVNNSLYTVAGATTDTFQLSGIDSTGFGTYTANGTVDAQFWNNSSGFIRFPAFTIRGLYNETYDFRVKAISSWHERKSPWFEDQITINTPDNIPFEPGATKNQWRGEWQNPLDYEFHDMVYNVGSTYLCTSPHTSSAATEPGVGASWDTVWDLAASIGSNVSVVYLYKRAATAGSNPSISLTYTFATGAIDTPDNGWTKDIPTADGNPLWAITATASASTPTDEILPGDWATAQKLAEDGADGSPGSSGLNVATVYIYQRNASTPTLPSTTATYTFSTGGITGLNNGWTGTVPTADGNPLWVSLATASNTSSTDDILSGEWQSAQKLAEDGADGAMLIGCKANYYTFTTQNDGGEIYFHGFTNGSPADVNPYIMLNGVKTQLYKGACNANFAAGLCYILYDESKTFETVEYYFLAKKENGVWTSYTSTDLGPKRFTPDSSVYVIGLAVQSATETVDFVTLWQYGHSCDEVRDTSDTLEILPSDDNLIGYWDCNMGSGTVAYDKSTSNNNGVFQGTSNPQWDVGIAGMCVKSAGIDGSRVTLAPSSHLNSIGHSAGYPSVTFSFWMKGYYNASDQSRLIAKSVSASDEFLFYSATNSNKLTVHFRTTPDGVISNTFDDITCFDGNWHHICVVIDLPNDICRVYMDAVESTETLSLAQFTNTIGISNSGYMSFLSATGGAYEFNGSMDEVRIYKKVLTKEEITGLYKNPSGHQSIAYGDSRLDGPYLTVGPNTERGEYATLEAALADLSTMDAGGIFIKNGTYDTSSQITLPNQDLTIIGQDRDGVILRSPTGSTTFFYSTGQAKHYRFSNFTVTSRHNTSSGTYYVFNIGSAATNLTFDNMKFNGVNVGTAQESMIRTAAMTGSLTVKSCVFNDGYTALSTSSETLDISGNYFDSQERYCISTTTNNTGAITGNSFIDFQYMVYAGCANFTGNYLKTTDSGFFSFFSITAGGTAVGNECIANLTANLPNTYGIAVTGSGTVCSGNIVKFTSSATGTYQFWGIVTNGSAQCSISGNKIYADGSQTTGGDCCGIRAFSSAHEITISGNNIDMVNGRTVTVVDYGVHLTNSNYITIVGNSILNAGDHLYESGTTGTLYTASGSALNMEN